MKKVKSIQAGAYKRIYKVLDEMDEILDSMLPHVAELDEMADEEEGAV